MKKSNRNQKQLQNGKQHVRPNRNLRPAAEICQTIARPTAPATLDLPPGTRFLRLTRLSTNASPHTHTLDSMPQFTDSKTKAPPGTARHAYTEAACSPQQSSRRRLLSTRCICPSGNNTFASASPLRDVSSFARSRKANSRFDGSPKRMGRTNRRHDGNHTGAGHP